MEKSNRHKAHTHTSSQALSFHSLEMEINEKRKMATSSEGENSNKLVGFPIKKGLNLVPK